MATIEDAARMAMALPSVTEGVRRHNRTWFVTGKGFAWERPFSKADIKRFGDEEPPAGPIFAVRVDDLGEKRPFSPPTRKRSSRSRTSMGTPPSSSS